VRVVVVVRDVQRGQVGEGGLEELGDLVGGRPSPRVVGDKPHAILRKPAAVQHEQRSLDDIDRHRKRIAHVVEQLGLLGLLEQGEDGRLAAVKRTSPSTEAAVRERTSRDHQVDPRAAHGASKRRDWRDAGRGLEDQLRRRLLGAWVGPCDLVQRHHQSSKRARGADADLRREVVEGEAEEVEAAGGPV